MGYLSHFDSRWAGTVTLQNLADAMGVSRERMRQIETVGLRKVEAKSADAAWLPSSNATRDAGGSRSMGSSG